MRTFLTAVVLSLSACGSSIPECVPVVDDPVADDESTPVGTAEAYLAAVATEQEMTGTWWDGAAAEAFVAVRRGLGSARWVETEGRSHAQLGGTASILVVCSAALVVPLEVEVQSSDHALFFDFADLGFVRQDPLPGDGALHLHGTYLNQIVPDGDEDPAAHGQKHVWARLTYADDAPTIAFAEMGWGGVEETDDFTVGHAVEVLELGEEPLWSPTGE